MYEYIRMIRSLWFVVLCCSVLFGSVVVTAVVVVLGADQVLLGPTGITIITLSCGHGRTTRVKRA